MRARQVVPYLRQQRAARTKNAQPVGSAPTTRADAQIRMHMRGPTGRFARRDACSNVAARTAVMQRCCTHRDCLWAPKMHASRQTRRGGTHASDRATNAAHRRSQRGQLDGLKRHTTRDRDWTRQCS